MTIADALTEALREASRDFHRITTPRRLRWEQTEEGWEWRFNELIDEVMGSDAVEQTYKQ